MKIETILNAMQKVRVGSGWDMDRRMRQIAAFRAQILRMDAEKDAALDRLLELKDADFEEMNTKIIRQEKRIAEYRKEIIEKDEEIRVLEKYIKDHDYKTILDYMEKYLEGDIE